MDQCRRASVWGDTWYSRLLRYSPRGRSHLVASLAGGGGRRRHVSRRSRQHAGRRGGRQAPQTARQPSARAAQAWQARRLRAAEGPAACNRTAAASRVATARTAVRPRIWRPQPAAGPHPAPPPLSGHSCHFLPHPASPPIGEVERFREGVCVARGVQREEPEAQLARPQGDHAAAVDAQPAPHLALVGGLDLGGGGQG
jgi:hypothetical protein